jgi:hypothetical protein
LHDEVERRAIVIWAVLTESGDRAVDNPRLAGTHRVISEPELGRCADAHVFDHDIRAVDQVEEKGASLWVLQVQFDALLVAIQRHEVRRLVIVERRSPLARHVAAARGLDLDDLGAVVSKHGRRERAGERVGEIDDRQPLEGHRSAL